MFKVISILFTEIIIFGVPIRSAIGLFLFVTWKSLSAMLSYFIILLFLYTDLNTFSNFNFVIFFVCTTSFIVFSRVRMLDKIKERNIINYVITGLIILGTLQVFQINFFTQFFSNYYNSFIGRASGLSSEPSFYSWTIAFFVFHSFAIRKVGFIGLISILTYTFLISFSVTIIFIGIVFAVCFVLAHFSKTIYLPTLTFLLCYHLLERIFFASGFDFLENLYNLTGSWREISHFLSLYGSDFIGPFSGGLDWPDQIYKANNYLFHNNFQLPWIVWPWSFSAMVSLELGYVGLFLFLVWILIGCRTRVDDVFIRSVSIFLIVSGFLFVPKWMVFYFVLPRLRGIS